MSSQVFTKPTGLPREGQPVEFVLDGRDVPINGTYAEHTFRSRWSGYEIGSVRAWRYADAASVAINESGHCIA